MKTLKGHNGNEYNSPETVAEQATTYRGYFIDWVRPPIPPGCGCEWEAYDDAFGGEYGVLHSDLVSDLKSQIDEILEEAEIDQNLAYLKQAVKVKQAERLIQAQLGLRGGERTIKSNPLTKKLGITDEQAQKIYNTSARAMLDAMPTTEAAKWLLPR